MIARLRSRPLTLRARLVLSVVALFTLASILVGGLSVFSLYGNLEERVNDQLSQITRITQPRNDGLGGTINLLNAPGVQPGSIIAVRTNGTVAGVVKPNFGDSAKELTAVQVASLKTQVRSSQPVTATVPGLGTYQFLRVDVSSISATSDFVYYGLPLAPTYNTVALFGLRLGLISIGGILLAALATWLIVSYALRPLRRVAATATEVASMELDRGEVDLSVRVPDADTDQRTEVGQVGAALNSMLGHVDDALRARQASESKVRQFVADASHELRTPLASIRGYAELTRRGNHKLPEDVTHSIGRVESEAVRMTSLVEDLLLLARLDEGRDLELAPVDLTRLLVDCIGDAHAASDAHEWELDAPEEPVTILGDGQRLHQVMVNILSNARVHTPEGTAVTTTLTVTPEDHAVITIVDDGPGIPPALSATLFERFARGDSSRARSSGSTGLGLAIVKAVVDGHDGEVSVTSEPGRTEFRIDLPGVVEPL